MATQKTLNVRLQSRTDNYANWIEKDPVLLSGELAVVVIPTDAGSGVNEPSIMLKVGDGTKKFSELGWISGLGADVYDWAKGVNKPEYSVEEISGLEDALENVGSKVKYSTVASVAEMNALESPNHSDVCIIKEKIGETDKEQYTAYVYDTNKWVAMDGNYSADNVYLSENITMAGDYTQVGNLSKSKVGTATFEVKGKSVAEALTEIFSKRLQPTKTNPSLSVTLAQAGAKEVGTEVTPTYSSTFRPGSYTYGPATGVTVNGYTVNGEEAAASGSLEIITVADSTNFKVTMVANYSDGVVAKDNLGSDSNPEIKIGASSVTANSSAITGYRSFFYGADNSEAEIDSTLVRSLTNGGAPSANKSITINANDSTKRIIVAIPHASNRAIKDVILTSSMNLDITATYIKNTDIMVEGVNGFTAVAYDVYVYAPAAVDAGEVHKITLK